MLHKYKTFSELNALIAKAPEEELGALHYAYWSRGRSRS